MNLPVFNRNRAILVELMIRLRFCVYTVLTIGEGNHWTYRNHWLRLLVQRPNIKAAYLYRNSTRKCRRGACAVENTGTVIFHNYNNEVSLHQLRSH